jgi:hypothetical protein
MLLRTCWILCLFLLSLPRSSHAVLLPDVDELKALLGEPPIEVEVVEPHLVEGENKPYVVYLGYPVEMVLSVVLAGSWKASRGVIEFRARDGYVSRIRSDRFDQHRAYLVFARRDAGEFKVYNRMQHQRDVPLGPYYLVWDNIHDADVFKEGSTYWPYQVNEILVSQSLPVLGEMSEYAIELEKYCLNCHRVNGSGGNKAPFDLAEQTKSLGREKFLAWVLDPSSMNPDTTMPAINESMPAGERRALATRLFEYLNELPRK